MQYRDELNEPEVAPSPMSTQTDETEVPAEALATSQQQHDKGN